ncbi:MAG: hypothetical protein LBG65_07475 [Puniceicoccales bacterium]|jgi:Rad3-related DNA helicase|nr:hypothetical protein [Puniceicoccales bacterium]
MRFTPGERRLDLAAGEFAGFGAPPQSFGPCPTGRWRADVGREWHSALRRQIEARDAASGTPGAPEAAAPDAAGDACGSQWAFEVPVRATLFCEGWLLVAEGRADQVETIPAPGPDAPERLVIREIKTVSAGVPHPPAWWRENFPGHFLQLALYCHGFAQDATRAGAQIQGVLVLVDPATGVMQEIRMEAPFDTLLAPQARLIARFAQSRWDARLRLDHLHLVTPFAAPRQEWAAALERLQADTSPVALLEAPTGFGKTSLALLDALGRLRDGVATRILYVTGKSSARLQVLRELDRMTSPGAIRVLTLHSRAEHAIPGTPSDPAAWRENWQRAEIDPARLFDEGRAGLAAVRSLGASAGVPPWEITKRLLPLAELVLCDYNYVFSPWQAGVLAGSAGWNPATTHLIVDEAHNLPDRAAEARSVEAGATEAWETLDTLRDLGAPREWLGAWGAWAEFLEKLPRADALSESSLYLARDIGSDITHLWLERPPFHLDLPNDALGALEKPSQLLPMLARLEDDAPGGRPHGSPESGAGQGEAPPCLPWSPRDGVLRAGCLDAAAETGDTLRSFGRVLLMSATLAPLDLFASDCGLRSATTHVCEAPWRDGAYDVRVDTSADTRLRARVRHYPDTARSVLEFCADGQAAVFFPSYAYAEAIQTCLRVLSPGFHAAIQPRGGTPAQNAAWLEEALLLAHALFLVAGGGMAEGIDLLGGRLSRAMVVSPCLPEATPERAARMEALRRLGAPDPFATAYLAPALRKVNQALGRLVRGPGQRAAVLLHCRRFATPAIQSLLAPEYRLKKEGAQTGAIQASATGDRVSPH